MIGITVDNSTNKLYGINKNSDGNADLVEIFRSGTTQEYLTTKALGNITRTIQTAPMVLGDLGYDHRIARVLFDAEVANTSTAIASTVDTQGKVDGTQTVNNTPTASGTRYEHPLDCKGNTATVKLVQFGNAYPASIYSLGIEVEEEANVS